MKERRIQKISRSPCTNLMHQGKTWSKRFLILFLIASCLATSAWYFAGPAQVAKAAADPALVGRDLTPRTAYGGSLITLSYTIDNPDPAPQDITLGATIGGPDGGIVEWFGDSEHAITISAAPGTSTYTRSFRISDRAAEGAYTVIWELIVDGVQVDWFAASQSLNIVVAPTVTITFDDGYASIYDHARPVLESYGFEATLFALTGMSAILDRPLMSVAQLQSVKADGWDIGSHSATHPFLTTLTQEQVQAEVSGSQDWLESNGLGPVYAFAYPYGDFNSGVMDTVAANYRYARGIIEGINSYGPNYNLNCVILQGNTSWNSLAHVEEMVTQAISQNKWAIVLCHGVTDDQNDPWTVNYGWVTSDVFAAFCEFLKDSEVPVKTFAQMEEGTNPSTPVNHAPVAVDDSYEVAENTALTVAVPGVLANDTDADSDALTAAVVTNPGHGTLALAANGSFTYTPAADYVGIDSFTYRANDTKVNSNAATVSISVTQSTGSASTFGLDDGAYQLYQGSGVISAQRFRNNAGTGTLSKLELRFSDANTPAGKVRMGVYADNNGSPGALLLDAGEVDAGTGWVAINGLDLAVTSGSYYWLACNLQYPNHVVVAWQVPNLSFRWINRLYGAYPTPFPGFDGIGDWSFVMRATVTQ